MMRGIGKVADIDKPDEDTNDSYDLGEHVPKIVKLTFERGLLRYLGCNRLVNIANRGFLASVDNDGLSISINDSGTLGIWQKEDLVIQGSGKRRTYREEHIRHILLDCPFFLDNMNGLIHAGTLSGKDSLVDTEATGRNRKQSAVRRNFVPNCHSNNISRDQFRGVNTCKLGGAKDFSLMRRVFLEGLCRQGQG